MGNRGHGYAHGVHPTQQVAVILKGETSVLGGGPVGPLRHHIGDGGDAAVRDQGVLLQMIVTQMADTDHTDAEFVHYRQIPR